MDDFDEDSERRINAPEISGAIQKRYHCVSAHIRLLWDLKPGYIFGYGLSNNRRRKIPVFPGFLFAVFSDIKRFSASATEGRGVLF
jgi:hypothetical protein